MIYSNLDHGLAKERAAQMRADIQHDRLGTRPRNTARWGGEASPAREERLALATKLSEEARLAKARLAEDARPSNDRSGEGSLLRRVGLVARGSAYVGSLFR